MKDSVVVILYFFFFFVIFFEGKITNYDLILWIFLFDRTKLG